MFDGKAMKAARRSVGITGQELARRVGVTNVTISRIENERQSPSRDLAERISRELAADIKSLYKEDDRGGGIAMLDLSSDERDIMVAFRRLDRIGQAKVWAFVMGLASGGTSEGAEAAAELAHAAVASERVSEGPASRQARRA